MAMQIALHLGAHKTASTFIQNVLARNAATLRGEGVGIVPHAELRRNVTAKLGRVGDKRRDAKRHDAERFLETVLAQPVRRLILSEENLIGSPHRLEADRALYTAIPRKLCELAPVLAGHDVTVFLSVRALAQFVSAILVECFRTGQYPPAIPDRYLEDWLDGTRNWVDVVADIRNVFPAAPILVWNHGDFFRNQQAVFERMTGVAGLTLDVEGLPRRPTPTGRAIEDFLSLEPKADKHARIKALTEASRRHPRSPDLPVFRLGDDAQAHAFRQRFLADLDAIASMGQGVELLVLPSATARQSVAR